MYSISEAEYNPYAPCSTILYMPESMLQQLPAPLRIAPTHPTVRDIAASLHIQRNTTQLASITPSGDASFKCYRGCTWNSSAACILINCHALRIEHFYKQRCQGHGIACHPNFTSSTLDNMIRQALIHASIGVSCASPQHQTHLCEACNYGQLALH